MMTMTTRMTKLKAMTRKKLRNSLAVQPARPFRHPTVWSITLFALIVSLALFSGQITALNPPLNFFSSQRPMPDDCILYVTVFTQHGARLPDATYVAHAVGKKKPHWEGYSDARGEFAVRISVQGDYEIEVKAKGYEPQTKKVTSEIAQKLDVVFNLVPRTPKKP